jgi:hypothetical protein
MRQRIIKGVKWAKDYEIIKAGGRIRTDGRSLYLVF